MLEIVVVTGMIRLQFRFERTELVHGVLHSGIDAYGKGPAFGFPLGFQGIEPGLQFRSFRDGIDVAKSIALGASIVGFAGAFLRAANSGGVAGVIDMAETVTEELRVAMFVSAAADHKALSNTMLHTRF